MRKRISRESIKEDWIKELLKTESHHNHPIVEKDGHYRWEQDPLVEFIGGNRVNEIVEKLYSHGYDKNSELYRKYYRKLGYSLNGYWEVFYWDMNNEKASEYEPPTQTEAE